MNSTTSGTKGNLAGMVQSSQDPKPSLMEQCEAECEDQTQDFQKLIEDVGDSLVQYCRRRPGVATLSVSPSDSSSAGKRNLGSSTESVLLN